MFVEHFNEIRGMELMDKKYWSVEEASQALGLSISTVRRRIRTGGIIAIQPVEDLVRIRDQESRKTAE